METLTVWLRCVPFLLVAAGVVVLTRRLCRRVLSSPRQEAAASWFGFSQYMKWLGLACWLSWLGGVILLDPWQQLGWHLEWPDLLRRALHNALTLLPPAVLLATCDGMTYPVVRKLRELEVSQKQFAVDALMGRLWLSLPAALMWTGFRATANTHRDVNIAMLFMGAGLVALLLIQVFWMRRRTSEMFTPHSLTVGDLRDRAFAMAAKAGVQLNQIYVFPMAKWRLANAYASEGNTLLLTDWLLRHLSTREVNAIIGHELAHMKRGHVGRQFVLMMVLWIPPILWIRMHPMVPDLAWAAFWILATWQVTTWAQSFLSRRHERQADLDGVRISEDPEAFCAALQRVDQLNAVPHDFSSLEQSLSTHPSTRRRIEAIQRAFPQLHIPAPMAPALAVTERSAGYTLPDAVEAATHGDGPLFNSTAKQKIVTAYTWAYLGVIGLPPVACAWMSQLFDTPAARLLIWMVGLGLYAALIVRVTDRVGRRRQARLRPAIAQRLANQFGSLPADARFVGLSPGDSVRVFEGCFSWDVGFLFLDGNSVHYVGEQSRFTLSRHQIQRIRVGAGPPRWSRTARVYVDWGAGERQAAGTFSLSCPDQLSFSADGRAAIELAAVLEQWWQNPDAVPGSPGLPARRLPPPMFGEVTSSCPRQSLRASQFISTLLLPGAVAVPLLIQTELLRQDPAAVALAVAALVAGHAFASLPVWRLPRCPQPAPAAGLTPTPV